MFSNIKVHEGETVRKDKVGFLRITSDKIRRIYPDTSERFWGGSSLGWSLLSDQTQVQNKLASLEHRCCTSVETLPTSKHNQTGKGVNEINHRYPLYRNFFIWMNLFGLVGNVWAILFMALEPPRPSGTAEQILVAYIAEIYIFASRI